MKYIYICIFALTLTGCFTTRPNPILTSKEQSWYIPKDVEFQAKKLPTDTLTTYKAEDDLMVLYIGKYLEVEKKANSCSK